MDLYMQVSRRNEIGKKMGQQKMQLLFSLLVISSFSCLALSLPSEFSITGYDPKDLGSEDRLVQLFQQWREKHGKIYEHKEEMAKRFENFKRNLKYVIEKNAKKSSPTGHSVGLNRFADMSNEEYREKYLSKVKKPAHKRVKVAHRHMGRSRGFTSCDAPSSLDWRKKGAVTGIKDQGNCGSCWAFSTTGAMEGVNAISTGELVSLSEQELVDCDSTNYGCEGGYMDYAFEWVINNGGIDSESGYPYTGVDGTCNAAKVWLFPCQVTDTHITYHPDVPLTRLPLKRDKGVQMYANPTPGTTEEATKVVSIDGYEDVDASDSALLCAAVNQPISVGIDASTMDFQLYTGGIYDGDCSSDPDDIDHAVLVVGYGSDGDEDYWIVKNSWGTSWGLEGYIYIRRNTDIENGVCAINAMASYPTKVSSAPSPYPSPAVPPPPPPSPPPPPPTPVTPPPPPPPPPSPSECGDFSYCPADQTCCCIYEFYGYCLIYGCCDYTNGVCCTGSEYCCPSDYPKCDVEDGLCLKNSGDYLGIAAKKKKWAKHKLPWIKPERSQKNSYQPLEWRRNPFAVAR